MADVVNRYKELPVITRGYVTLCLITTAACTLEVGGRTHKQLLTNPAFAMQPNTIWSCPLVSADHIPFQHLFQRQVDLEEDGAVAAAVQLLLFWAHE